MKVKIGKYPKYTSLYRFEEILYKKLKMPENKFTEVIVDVVWYIYRLVMPSKRKIYVRIDRHDTINMNTTLANIIVPMLEQLKRDKPGSPHIDINDVPPDYANCDVHGIWDYVLGEMIFAFKCHMDDWEDQFYIYDTLEEVGDGIYRRVSEDDANIFFDRVGYDKHKKRMDVGVGYFAKYYHCLWQ